MNVCKLVLPVCFLGVDQVFQHIAYRLVNLYKADNAECDILSYDSANTIRNENSNYIRLTDSANTSNVQQHLSSRQSYCCS